MLRKGSIESTCSFVLLEKYFCSGFENYYKHSEYFFSGSENLCKYINTCTVGLNSFSEGLKTYAQGIKT